MMCGMAEQSGVGEVSRREAEVLAAVGAHLSNAEIARSLFISVRTVESHVSSLLRKYGVADRRALAALAAPAQERTEPGQQAGIELGRIAGLPTFRTTLVGRAAERAAVLAALESAPTRGTLVTLLGPGGVGKTRLATAVAADAAPAFPLGGAFVDLVPATAEYVTQTVAAALGVTERLKQPLEEVLHDRLRRGRTLLVLDNCEHVVDAAAGFVERVLAACPETAVLVTSRERLDVLGERVVQLDPLPVAGEAQELFRQRAADVDPGFAADHDTVAEICARLDGMPLAIELAAARSASLGPDGLLAGLDDAVRLLSGGRRPDRRHGSLRAVVDWSYRLLDDDEQAMFRGLAVFAGSFDVAAVVDVVAPGTPAPVVADLMGRLVDKSLVMRGGRGWRLLAPLRAFAAEQLGAGEECAAARQRHLNWAAATAEHLERGLPGTVEAVDAVLDDLRAALDAAVPGEDPGVPHRLARSLARLCFARRFLVEALDHYRRAAELAPSAEDAAADLVAASGCAHVATASSLAYELLQLAVERAPTGSNAAASTTARLVEVAHRFHTFYDTVLDDGRIDALLDGAIATADHTDPVVAARLAIAAAWRAGPAAMTADRAKAADAVAAAHACGDPLLVNAALDALCSAALHDGEVRAAHRITRDRLALLPGLDRTDPACAPEIEDAYYVAATTAMAAGDLRAALQIGREVQADELVGRHPFIAASDLAAPLLLAGGPGELDEGFALVEAMWDQWLLAGRPAAIWMVPALAAAALAAGLRGDTASRARWRARVDEIGRTGAVGPRDGDPFVAFVDARLALWEPALSDHPTTVEQLVERAFLPFRHSRFWPYAHAAGAELAVVAGLPDAAERLAAARGAAAENDWAATCLDRATGRFTGDPGLLAAAVEGWERVGCRWERAETLLLLPDRAAEGQAELADLRS
jgi:predicted ATPase/DNA-binding CsgD family transcriptional regulator